MHLPRLAHTTVFFDLETGGLELSHPIIQIAAVAISPEWKELGAFQRKLKFPVHRCTKEALETNSYDEATWEREAVNPMEAVTEFATWLNNHKAVELVSKRTGRPYKVALLSGYNCESFDKPRIMELYRQCGQFLPAHPRTIDVLQLVQWAHLLKGKLLQDYKLGTVAKHYGINPDNYGGAHDALADVRVTIAVARQTIQDMAWNPLPDDITEAEDFINEELDDAACVRSGEEAPL